MAQTVVTDAQNGATVQVAVGDVVVVRLPENPTTGYRWQISAAPALGPTGDEFTMGLSSAPGAGGERTLRLTAAKAGVFHVQAALRRPWESGSAPKAVFGLTVEVH